MTGEVVSVPLPRTVISIWPLPFGLLLQQSAEVNPSLCVPFSSASPTLGSREMLRQRKEVGNISPQIFHSPVAHDLISKRDMSCMSSHLILRDPLEEPGVNDLIRFDIPCLLYSYFMPVLFLFRDLNYFLLGISTAHISFLFTQCLVIFCIW